MTNDKSNKIKYIDMYHPVILDNIERMIICLSLSDIAHLKQALGKQGGLHFERIFSKLHHRYFPNILRPNGVTVEQHFKNTVLNLLSALREQDISVYAIKKMGVEISAYDFYDMARNEVEIELPYDISDKLPPSAECHLKLFEWFLALQESYHGLQEKRYARILNKICFFYSYRKEYPALENIVSAYPEIVDTNLLCFYAKNDHPQKVKDLIHSTKWSIRDLKKALLMASYKGYLAVARELLNHIGEEISVDEKGKLFAAAGEGGIQVIEELLYRFEGEISIKYKAQAFENAANEGHVAVVHKLFSLFKEEISSYEDGIYIYEAVKKSSQQGHLNIVLEIASQLEKEQFDTYAGSAFIEACQYQNHKVIDFLFNRIERKEHVFTSILGICEEEILERIVNELSVEYKGILLMYAVSYSKDEMANNLLELFGQETMKDLLDRFGQRISEQDKEQAMQDIVSNRLEYNSPLLLELANRSGIYEKKFGNMKNYL